MKYYLGVDYFIYFEDFPHMGVPGVIAANSDGTANIYINTLYNEDCQRRAIRHELRHLARCHFYCDWLTLAEKELEADDGDDPTVLFGEDFSSVEWLGSPRPPRPVPPRPDPAPPADAIPLFNGLEALTRLAAAARAE